MQLLRTDLRTQPLQNVCESAEMRVRQGKVEFATGSVLRVRDPSKFDTDAA